MVAEAALLDDLLGDRTQIEFCDPPTASGVPAIPHVDLGPRLISLVCRDLVCLGFQMAAVTSAINQAQGQGKPAAGRNAVLGFLPGDARLGRNWLEQLLYSTVSTSLILDIREFYARFESVRSLTVSYYQNQYSPRQPDGVNQDILAGSWQQLCWRLSTLIDSASKAYPVLRTVAGQHENVRKLLAACANGGAPCMLSDGTIEVKGWVERRKEARWPVDWNAVLLLGLQDASAKVINISVGGACIQTSVQLNLSELITYELASGRRLVGEVRWSSSHTYGTRFIKPLAADDPIFLDAGL